MARATQRLQHQLSCPSTLCSNDKDNLAPTVRAAKIFGPYLKCGKRSYAAGDRSLLKNLKK